VWVGVEAPRIKEREIVVETTKGAMHVHEKYRSEKER